MQSKSLKNKKRNIGVWTGTVALFNQYSSRDKSAFTYAIDVDSPS
jgi:hypothetical protein